MGNKINIWYISSLIISIFVAIPIITVFSSYFSSTSEYMELLKDTFLKDYIFNSFIILTGVLFFTFILGVVAAYFVSFYNFPHQISFLKSKKLFHNFQKRQLMNMHKYTLVLQKIELTPI